MSQTALEPRALPRLLCGLMGSHRLSLVAHEQLHGPLPHADRRLIDEIAASGLTGCGGAAFPFATKLRAVAGRRGRPVVLVNGSEGESLSHKDKLLLVHLPHLVIDGALSVARALGSHEIVIAVESPSAVNTLTAALAERGDLNRRGMTLTVELVAGGYLTGQETALIAALSGRQPKPTLTPPYPFERGLRGRPTVVSNAETFAHVALIARHGADWFRALGTPQSPGTRLVTVSGSVRQAGVIEIAGGTDLDALLNAAGGATENVQGVLLGGYAGVWAGPEALHWRLGETELRSRGATLGPGIVHVLSESGCVVAQTARAARWLSDESAGQCGPCVNGLDAIASALEQLCDRGDRSGAYDHIERWCALVTGRGACALPDGAARFVTSALRTFRPVFQDHALHGRCEACAQGHRVRVTRVRREVPA